MSVVVAFTSFIKDAGGREVASDRLAATVNQLVHAFEKSNDGAETLIRVTGFDGLVYDFPFDVLTGGVNRQLFIDLLGAPHSGLAYKDGRRMILCPVLPAEDPSVLVFDLPEDCQRLGRIFQVV